MCIPNVPLGKIKRADGSGSFPAGWTDKDAIHVLPESYGCTADPPHVAASPYGKVSLTDSKCKSNRGFAESIEEIL